MTARYWKRRRSDVLTTTDTDRLKLTERFHLNLPLMGGGRIARGPVSLNAR